MKKNTITTALLLLASMHVHAQAPVDAPTTTQPTPAQLQQQIQAISAALAATQAQIQQSQQQMLQLQQQLQTLQQQMAAAGMATPPVAVPSAAEPPVVAAQPAPAALPPSTASTTEEINEHLAVLDAEVKQHAQTKLESESKYPIRISGLLLFNAFVNNGVVDYIDLPSLAARSTPGVSNGSAGAGLRQTILGLEGTGPTLWGARTSANINIDFFGGISYSNYGTSAGSVRMRTANVSMAWKNDIVQAGFVGPLISPLSPTSYATVAEPGMAWAGNLWTWAPQISIDHHLQLQNGSHIGMQFGLWDSPSAGFTTSEIIRAPSPSELSKQPAYEARISYAGKDEAHGLELGMSGYYSRQSYSNDRYNDSWAVTWDWRLPLPAHFELSGEAYRGRSLGGLGGGVYKDVLTGTPDPITGIAPIRGLNAIGGWSQLKWKPRNSFELNATMGQDSGFASDFHTLLPPVNASSTQLRARNQMAVANLIFRPKSYLIFSPEYRRIWTWPIIGAGATADIFTLSIGYQF
jgi:uncharacterized coiled-coil protein SlyX